MCICYSLIHGFSLQFHTDAVQTALLVPFIFPRPLYLVCVAINNFNGVYTLLCLFKVSYVHYCVVLVTKFIQTKVRTPRICKYTTTWIYMALNQGDASGSALFDNVPQKGTLGLYDLKLKYKIFYVRSQLKFCKQALGTMVR